jgi:ABC-2 type transport system permease protein
MAENHIPEKHLPQDLAQLPVVWTYELLKYLRSRRLIAAVAVVIAVLALIYLLPPALGNAYSGTDTNEYVTVTPFPTPIELQGLNITVTGFGAVNRSDFDPATLTLYRDGEIFPQGLTSWTLIPSISVAGYSLENAILFTRNVTEHNFTATYDWSVTAEDFATRFANFVRYLVIICATFFAADSIVSEYQNRTGYLIFPNPVKRSTLFFGKFAASMTAGTMVVALFYGGVALLSLVTLGGLDKGFGLSFALSVEFLVAAVAVAYLISSVLKGSTGALVLTFFLFLLIMPIIDGVSAITNTKIEWSLTFSAGALMFVLIHPYPVDSSQAIPGFGTFGNFYPTPEMAAIVMATYAIIAIVLSLLLFRRKQLLG